MSLLAVAQGIAVQVGPPPGGGIHDRHCFGFEVCPRDEGRRAEEPLQTTEGGERGNGGVGVGIAVPPFAPWSQNRNKRVFCERTEFPPPVTYGAQLNLPENLGGTVYVGMFIRRHESRWSEFFLTCSWKIDSDLQQLVHSGVYTEM